MKIVLRCLLTHRRFSFSESVLRLPRNLNINMKQSLFFKNTVRAFFGGVSILRRLFVYCENFPSSHCSPTGQRNAGLYDRRKRTKKKKEWANPFSPSNSLRFSPTRAIAGHFHNVWGGQGTYLRNES